MISYNIIQSLRLIGASCSLINNMKVADLRGYYESQMMPYDLPSYNLRYYIYKRVDDRRARNEAISDQRLIAIESIRSIIARE